MSTSVGGRLVVGGMAQDQRRYDKPKGLVMHIAVSIQFANALFHSVVNLSSLAFARGQCRAYTA